MAILKSVLEKPGYTLMRGIARFGVVRDAVAALRERAHRADVRLALEEYARAANASPFRDLEREEFVQRLEQDGLAMGLVLPGEVTSRIVSWTEQHPCYADRDPRCGFTLPQRSAAEQQLGKPILLAQYFNTMHECRDIRDLADDPVLRWIATRYLRSRAVFVGANLWWTFPVKPLEADRHRHAHLFHRDVDDFRFFKFFFYLTDVPEGEGAHVCVAGSHRGAPVLRLTDRWKIRRYSDAEIERAYGAERVVELCGPAGTGFAENTLCMHKGSTPKTSARLLLQLQFALFDYGVMNDERAPDILSRLT